MSQVATLEMRPLEVLGQLPSELHGGVLGGLRVKISDLCLKDSSSGFWLGPEGVPLWTLVGGDDLPAILNSVKSGTPLGRGLLRMGLILHPKGSQKTECLQDVSDFAVLGC